MVDFSTSEGKELFRKAVDRQVLLGVPRDKAEMITAVLMWEGPNETIPSQVAPGKDSAEGVTTRW